MNPYFGTNQPLPPVQLLRAGRLSMQYERGNLRYICLDDSTELVRLIYAAVRDSHWVTAPYEIVNEIIEASDDCFSIQYTARYVLDDIRYEADFALTGTSESSISVQMHGRALSNFLRNRIGLCVHHPIDDCAGKTVEICQPDGGIYRASFPTEISPHQPFRSIREMRWNATGECLATLQFEGDTFETEDQRNWSDASYKTYSTPLSLPFPVQIREGETLRQQITLRVVNSYALADTQNLSCCNNRRAISAPLPALGFCRSSSSLSDWQVEGLRKLHFKHYRVEVRLNEDWQIEFRAGVYEARRLALKIELVVFFSDKYETEIRALFDELAIHSEAVSSLLPLSQNSPATPPELLQRLYSTLKPALPTLLIGYGTEGFFAELNRNRPPDNLPFDFICYSLNPQVHADDFCSIIENLQAQASTVEMAQRFAGDRPVYVSPVTLKPRHYPPQPPDDFPRNADERQFSDFVAAFTLLSLKYLSASAQITFYEAVGIRGLLPNNPNELAPTYESFVKLADFEAQSLSSPIIQNPLNLDSVTFCRTSGQAITVEVDWHKGVADWKIDS